MIVIPSRKICPPLRCGKSCLFCYYEASDDSYHCIFFRSKIDTEMINMYAEEKRKYYKCPVFDDVPPDRKETGAVKWEYKSRKSKRA